MPSSITSPAGSEVILNVYDLITPQNRDALPQINSYLYHTGLGLYHSGVQVYQTEYAFAGHQFPHSGVFECTPRQAPEAKFRQAIRIGVTRLDELQIAKVLHQVAGEWPGNRYNLLTRNCNDFADCLCKRLTGKGAPAWINRMAWIGQRFKFMLPEEFVSPVSAPVTPDDPDEFWEDTPDERSGRSNGTVTRGSRQRSAR